MTQKQALKVINRMYPDVLTTTELHLKSDGKTKCWVWAYVGETAEYGVGATWEEAVENLWKLGGW